MLTGRLPIRNGFYSDNFRGRNGNCIKSSNMRANGYFFIFILHNCSLHSPGDRRRNPRLGNPNIRVVARQGWISHQAGRQVAPRAQRAGAKKKLHFFLKIYHAFIFPSESSFPSATASTSSSAPPTATSTTTGLPRQTFPYTVTAK